MQCIRKVHAGELWLEKRSVSSALEKMVEREVAAREASAVLSRREIEVVRLVTGGLRNKEIANKLFISEGTIKVHLHTIYEKLSVHSRLELSLYARDKGLVEPGGGKTMTHAPLSSPRGDCVAIRSEPFDRIST